MIKYPKTPQFRNIIQEVKKRHDFVGVDDNGQGVFVHRSPYPVLKFDATVKIHGTNAAIVFYADGSQKYQSRERELTLEEDNAGFMQAMSSKDLHRLRTQLESYTEYSSEIVVFGEWCGGSVQKGVAVSQLKEKIFVIFQVLINGKPVDWKASDHKNGIYSIFDFPHWEVEIDFNNPSEAQNEIVKLTQEVENQCPVGKYFGIDGVGEGIVLRCQTDPNLFFKSKGEKHSCSRVKTLAEVDPAKLKSVTEFIDYAVTENRLNQGLERFSLENKNIGSYLQWVVKDIAEEEADVLVNSQLEIKDVSKQISQKAREFFFSKMNEL